MATLAPFYDVSIEKSKSKKKKKKIEDNLFIFISDIKHFEQIFTENSTKEFQRGLLRLVRKKKFLKKKFFFSREIPPFTVLKLLQ